MPNYRVVSGEYETTINRECPQKAAIDGIGKLKINPNDAKLGFITIVCPVDNPHDEVFVLTTLLLKENDLNNYGVEP